MFAALPSKGISKRTLPLSFQTLNLRYTFVYKYTHFGGLEARRANGNLAF